MIRRLTILPLLVTLITSGCAEMAAGEMETATKACNERADSGELKTAVARVDCISNARIAILSNYDYEHMDLERLRAAKAMDLAEKIDSKKITLSQAKLELAAFEVDTNTQARARSAQDSQARSAMNPTAIMGLNMMSTGSFSGNRQPNWVVPPPVNCTSMRSGPGMVSTSCY